MTDDSKQQKISELEAQLRELRGEDEPVYSFAELQALSKEEVDAEWDRVQRSLAALSTADASADAGGQAATTRVAADAAQIGPSRMAGAYAARETAKSGDSS